MNLNEGAISVNIKLFEKNKFLGLPIDCPLLASLKLAQLLFLLEMEERQVFLFLFSLQFSGFHFLLDLELKFQVFLLVLQVFFLVLRGFFQLF